MSKKPKKIIAIEGANPEFARVARKREPKRIHFLDPAYRGFCKLCGQQTEYAVAIQQVKVFERMEGRKDAKAVPFKEEMRAEARKLSDQLVHEYKDALAGKRGAYGIGELLLAYGDIRAMGGDSSLESFQDYVVQACEFEVWLRYGDMFNAPKPPGKSEGRQRPSKLYCNLHNPNRSTGARRAYQRDRLSLDLYEALVAEMWSACAGHLKRWDINDEALVRNACYHSMRIIKIRTRALEDHYSPNKKAHLKSLPKELSHEEMIENYYKVARDAFYTLRNLLGVPKNWRDDLKANGITTQKEIAERLGVSHQAVSAALKRGRNAR